MKEKTKTWLELAEDDLELARSILRNNNRPRYAVHFCHQALEKILKAIIQECTSADPIRTHKFKRLWEQGGILLSEEQKEFLLKLQPHYVASRYPEDIRALHNTYTEDFLKDIMNRTEELFKWLRNYLKSNEQ